MSTSRPWEAGRQTGERIALFWPRCLGCILLKEITQEQQVREEDGLGFVQASVEVPVDIRGVGLAQCVDLLTDVGVLGAS